MPFYDTLARDIALSMCYLNKNGWILQAQGFSSFYGCY